MKRSQVKYLVIPVLLAVFALLTSVAVLAGLKVTEKHDGWQLTAGTKVTGYLTYEECVAAVRVLGPGDYKCKDVTTIKAEFTCDDEPMPVLKLLVNAEGFTVQPGLVVELAANGVDWQPTKQEGFVKGPGYPNCWVPGLIPYQGEPLTVEGPPSQEPGPWVYCHDYGSIAHPPVGKACPANAPAGCYIPKNAPDVCPVTP
jgi:hypothetical protein